MGKVFCIGFPKALLVLSTIFTAKKNIFNGFNDSKEYLFFTLLLFDAVFWEVGGK